MIRLIQCSLIALIFVFCSVSFGMDIKVLPLNAPELPNEKLYSTIMSQVMTVVQESGFSLAENADYALRVSVLVPNGSLMVGAEVRGVKSFYKKEAVNVQNVSMLDYGIRQTVAAVLNEVLSTSDADFVIESFNEAPVVNTRTIRDTVIRVDTIVKVDTVIKVEPVSKIDTVTIVDTVEIGNANLSENAVRYIMAGFSFADLFFLREYTVRYKEASLVRSGYYDRRYDIYDTEMTYTTEEQGSSNQFSLGFAYESPVGERLSKVYSVNFGINDSDWLLAFADNLKFNLLEKRSSRKWNMFVLGGLGPVVAYVESFTDDYDDVYGNNAIESLGSLMDESVHLGVTFDVALGVDFNVNKTSKLEIAVKIEQVWLDFLDKLCGNRMFAIIPYVAFGF